MLSDAIRDIAEAVRIDRQERERRHQTRAGFERADGFMWQIEEMLEDGTQRVPDPVVVEIARFVRPYSRRLARLLTRDPERDPALVLDVLFDVQERMQQRQATGAAVGEQVPEALAS